MRSNERGKKLSRVIESLILSRVKLLSSRPEILHGIWLVLSLIYCSSILFLRLSHEPWRDELQSWLLLKHEGGIDFVNEYQLKGSLGYFLFYEIITLVFTNYFTYRFISSVLLVVVLYFFLCSKRLTIWPKVWLGINPLFIYEFLIIDRVYSLILVIIWVIYILETLQLRNYKLICCFLLIVLTNLSIVGLFTALILLVSIGKGWFRLKVDKKYVITLFVSFAINLLPFLMNYGSASWTKYDSIDVSNLWLKVRGFIQRLSELFYGEYRRENFPQYYQLISEHLDQRYADLSIIIIIIALGVYFYTKICFKYYLLTFLIVLSYGFLNIFVYPGAKRHLLFLPLFIIIVATQKMSIYVIKEKKLWRRSSLSKFTATIASLMLAPSLYLQTISLANFIVAERKIPFSTVHQLNIGAEREIVIFFPDYLSMGYLARFEERINKETVGYFVEGDYTGVFRDFENSRLVKTKNYLIDICNKSKNNYLVTSRKTAELVLSQELGTIQKISGRALVPEEGNVFKIKLNPFCANEIDKLFRIFESVGTGKY